MKQAFTLAEILITLAIIGVVAALTIPSVVANTQQQEFKTGLRKAVSVLNSAITMNMALDGETPLDNQNLFLYLQRHMSVMSSTTDLSYRFAAAVKDTSTGKMATWTNFAFYTTDGMRFEFWDRNAPQYYNLPLHENSNIQVCMGNRCNGCGSYGLANNVNNTQKRPCLITVDVNGDRKPSPSNISCKRTAATNNPECASAYKLSDPLGKKLTDIFSIMITDSSAIPYGIAAQKAMYEAQK